MNVQTEVKKVTNSIDWGLVISLIVAALVLAGMVLAMKKSGFKLLKDVAANVG